jgi:hypothetical protein
VFAKAQASKIQKLFRKPKFFGHSVCSTDVRFEKQSVCMKNS